MHRSIYTLLSVVGLTMILTPMVWADQGATDKVGSEWWAVLLAWLVPVGLGLIACGATPPERTAAVVRVGWLALAIAVIGYWLCGFAFQFGGIGFFVNHPDFSALSREWMWRQTEVGWGGGVIGLSGFMLRGATTPTAQMLFLAQLPWLTTAIAVLLWSLQGRADPLTLFIGSILIAFLYVLFGNWTWGGGWLAALGVEGGLGHGWVDAWGVGAVFLSSGAAAFAGMLALGIRRWARADYRPSPAEEQDRPPLPMPPLYQPTLSTLGAWLTLIGWIGWGLSTPPRIVGTSAIDLYEPMIGVLLAAAGGTLVTGTLSWLLTGRVDALMAARGVVGALIAAGAGAPFMPLWASLAVGAGGGLLVVLIQYIVEHLLRLDDPTSAVATHAFPALWGLLAVGLFADGHAGQGWNRVEATQGIAGMLGGVRAQFQAQLIGALAIALTAFFLPWLFFALRQTLIRAWHGEYAWRLPAHSDGEPVWTRLRERIRGLQRPKTPAPPPVQADSQAVGESDADV